MVLGPLFASGGDVTGNAGHLVSSGKITAYGGPTISVNNYTPDYLGLASISNSAGPGGHLILTGGAVAPPSIQVSLSGSSARPIETIQELYDQPVPASNGNANGPAVFLTAIMDSQGNVFLDPTGSVNNLAGQIAIT